MADLPVVAVLRLAGQQPVLGDAVIEFAERDLLVVRADRDLVALALLLLDELIGVAVQPFGVDRVERVFHDLEPVAGHDRAAEHADRAFGDEAVEARQQRLGFGGTEIGPDHAAQFLDGIGGRADLVAERAFLRLVRLREAFAVPGKLPAVIGAADAVLGRDAISERGAAVRAPLGDQAEPALAVLEQHEVFTEHADALVPDLAFELGCRCDRVPVAAHQVAGRGARPDAGEQFVLLRRQHGVVSYSGSERSARQFTLCGG